MPRPEDGQTLAQAPKLVPKIPKSLQNLPSWPKADQKIRKRSKNYPKASQNFRECMWRHLAPTFGLVTTFGELLGQLFEFWPPGRNTETHLGRVTKFQERFNFWEPSGNLLDVGFNFQSLTKSYLSSKSNFPKVTPQRSQTQKVKFWEPSGNHLKACQMLAKS